MERRNFLKIFGLTIPVTTILPSCVLPESEEKSSSMMPSMYFNDETGEYSKMIPNYEREYLDLNLPNLKPEIGNRLVGKFEKYPVYNNGTYYTKVLTPDEIREKIRDVKEPLVMFGDNAHYLTHNWSNVKTHKLTAHLDDEEVKLELLFSFPLDDPHTSYNLERRYYYRVVNKDNDGLGIT